MKYLWDHVHYLRQSSMTTSTLPDANGLGSTSIWKLGEGAYKGQPALRLQLTTNSSTGPQATQDTIGFNMSFDLYFSRAGDTLTLLGGYAYIQFAGEPEAMQGEINVSQMVEESRYGGGNLGEADEYVTANATPGFSPTLNLSSPIKPAIDENPEYNIGSGYDINTLMGGSVAQYQGMGDIALTPAGKETLHIGSKAVDCYKYTWRVQLGEGTANYTAWYSPEFPAQPLKQIADVNNGQMVTTTIVDEWN
jgi:hypothetical protein